MIRSGPARSHLGVCATPGRHIIDGALLMTLSLGLVLLVNVIARRLTVHYPAGEVLFFRFLGSVVVLAALSGNGVVAALRSNRRGLHLLRAGFGVGATLSLYLSLQHLPFCDLMAICYSGPLFVAALSLPVLGERIGLRRSGLLAAGAAGVLLIAFPGRIDIWSFGALAMALLNAGAMLATRSLGRSDGTTTVSLYFALFGSLLATPLLLFGCVPPNLHDAPLFGLLALAAGLAVRCHAEAFKRADASIIAPIDYLAVPAAQVIGWLAWAEPVSAATVIGGSVIVVAGVLQVQEARREANATAV